MRADPDERLGRMLHCAVVAYQLGVGFDYHWRQCKDLPVDSSWTALAQALLRHLTDRIGASIFGGQPSKLDDAWERFIEAERATKLQALDDEIKALREASRGELAAELKTARQRLVDLRSQVESQTELVRLFANSLLDRSPEHPPTPQPIVPASEKGDGLPSGSGIYFVWSDGIVVYVGQSVNLAQRARSKGHEAINPGDLLSWLPFEKETLNWAECFYIGVHRPIRNFGGAYRLNALRAATEGE